MIFCVSSITFCRAVMFSNQDDFYCYSVKGTKVVFFPLHRHLLLAVDREELEKKTSSSVLNTDMQTDLVFSTHS